MGIQTDVRPDAAEVDESLAGDMKAMYTSLMGVAKQYSGDNRVREFALFAALEVAVRFCPHGEEASPRTQANIDSEVVSPQ